MRPGSWVDTHLKVMNKVPPEVTLGEEEAPALLCSGHVVPAWGPSLALRARRLELTCTQVAPKSDKN